MKVQKRGEVSRELMTRCLKIMMMLCFMVSAEDVISQSYYGSASSFQQTSSFSSTSSLIKPKNNYSPASMRSATTVSARGLYTSTKGLTTTSAKTLHSTVSGNGYNGGSLTHSNKGNAYSAATHSAMSLSSPQKNVGRFTSANNRNTPATLNGKTLATLTGSGIINRGSFTYDGLAVRPGTALAASTLYFSSDSRRFAPGGGPGNAIVNSFINWLEATGTDNPAWLYDDDMGDGSQVHWFYNMEILSDLWEAFHNNNNLPYTWDQFFSWFMSYEIDESLQPKYRAPIGDGVWVMIALAAVYVIYRICKKNLKNSKL